MTPLRAGLLAISGLGGVGLALLTPSIVRDRGLPATVGDGGPPAHVTTKVLRPLPDLGRFLHPGMLALQSQRELEREAPPDALAAIERGLSPAPAAAASFPATVSSPRVEAVLASTAMLAYAATPESLRDQGAPGLATPPAIYVDIAGVREAIAAFRSGDLAAADAASALTNNPVARAAVDWAGARLTGRFDRVRDFLAARPEWPANPFLRKRAEEALWGERRPPAQVIEFFRAGAPETAPGKLSLARALQASDRAAEASDIVRQVWRDYDLNAALETTIRKEFADALTKADHKYRSDRLAMRENSAASLRAAALAGADALALAKARESLNDKVIAALPPELKKDPTLLFARVQKLRRDNKVVEAAQLLLAAPRDPAPPGKGDEWWIERRLLARKVLDLGDAKTAWRIVAEHSANAREYKIDAEFHAGWIALRFLEDPGLAKKHFAACAGFAETPVSIARAAYWRGRAAEALGESDEATTFFQTASSHSTTYYGLLARARLGRSDIEVRKPARVATGDDRVLAVRVVELLEALDMRDLSTPLALESARKIDDEAQIAALAAVTARARDAGATLAIGKLASQRGFPLDESAFPAFGVPDFEPLAKSADRSVVYAIARQESAFAPKALSGAGAKGLMQMMTPTARGTAKRAGVPFDEDRLTRDAAFNAQLGAAHLGDLLGEYRNSHILAFAAYNAGGRRVKEWIAAYGDPRDPGVDPVDWIERIPFAETRNYVQRIVENLEVYRVRLGDRPTFAIERTLREAAAR